jgi:hypothetical protein
LGLKLVAGGKRFIGDSEVYVKGDSLVIKGVTHVGRDGLSSSLTKKAVQEHIGTLQEDIKTMTEF